MHAHCMLVIVSSLMKKIHFFAGSPVLQAPPIFAGSPVLQAPPTPSGLISAEESDINPSEPEPVVEKKSAAFYIGSKCYLHVH